MTEKEYQQAMREAKAEYDTWLKENKRGRAATKAKYKAERLAKLHMQEMGLL